MFIWERVLTLSMVEIRLSEYTKATIKERANKIKTENIREVDDRSILDRFCEDFCKVVERHTKYIIVSGFVAIAAGRVRGTEDIDMIIPKITETVFIALHNDLEKNGFVCVQSDNPKDVYNDYLILGDPLRYTWKNRPVPEMEMKFAKDELDKIQFQTREKIPFTGLDVWFSSIPMNVAFKEELLKSDKDMEDAKHLRKVFREKISEKDVQEIKKLIRKYRL